MKPLINLLIKRFILGNPKQTSIPKPILFSFFIIAISTCCAALIISIMHGFQDSLYKSLQGMHADIVMEFGQKNGIDRVIEQLHKLPQIDNVYWHADEHILLRSKKNETIQVGLLKGIHYPQEKKNYLDRILFKPKSNLTVSTLLTQNNIFIGSTLAEQLAVDINDSIEILVPTDYKPMGKKIILDSYQATIAGIFKTGIDEFDTGFIFSDIKFFNQLFPEIDQATISVSLHNINDELQTIETLRQLYNVPIFTWKELYPSLLAALKLERYVMIFLFILLSFLICSIVSASFIIVVLRRQKDIAILKAFGASSDTIMIIFLIIATIVTVCGSIIGLLAAYGSGLAMQKLFIPLPGAYMVPYIPIKLEFSVFLSIFIVMLILIWIAGIIGIWQIKYNSVNRLLRSENF